LPKILDLLNDVAYYSRVLRGRAPSDSLSIYIMYDGEDTQTTPPAPTDSPVEETVAPQEAEAADADEATEAPAQA
jgi:hypothetical protein